MSLIQNISPELPAIFEFSPLALKKKRRGEMKQPSNFYFSVYFALYVVVKSQNKISYTYILYEIHFFALYYIMFTTNRVLLGS